MKFQNKKSFIIIVLFFVAILIIPTKIKLFIQLLPYTMYKSVYAVVSDVTGRKNLTNKDNSKYNNLLSYSLKLQEQNRILKRKLNEVSQIKSSPNIPKRGFLVADVIAGPDSSQWRRSFIINAGSNNGIKPGYSVISQGVIVGRVSDVTGGCSRVQLITDPAFRLMVRIDIPNSNNSIVIHKDSLKGILHGDSGEKPIIKIKYLHSDIKDIIKNNMSVVTDSNGLSDLCPAGMLVGFISEVSSDYGEYLDVNVKSAINNFSDIKYVVVIFPDKSHKDELNKLIEKK